MMNKRILTLLASVLVLLSSCDLLNCTQADVSLLSNEKPMLKSFLSSSS